MVMGAYKLSSVNKGFKSTFYSAVSLIPIAITELIGTLLDFFGVGSISPLLPYVYSVRFLIVSLITLFFMLGVSEVADEVEALPLAKRGKISAPFSAIILIVGILELPFVDAAIPQTPKAYVFVFALMAFAFLIISNLVTIYKTYMQICMPEDKSSKKQGKDGLFSKFEAYEEKKSREYAEYKINKDIERIKRKTKKK
jgi:hypothetical protein